MAVAAKSRVCRCENAQLGGLRVHQRAERLRRLIASCDDLGQLSWAHTWLNGNFLFRLAAADGQAQAALVDRQRQGTLPREYDNWIAAQAIDARPGSRKRSLQAVATRILRPPTSCPVQLHFRRRLDGFRLHTLLGRRVARAIHIIRRLCGLVAPSVVAAYIRTVCDGWMTHARFQSRGACRFGSGSRDSISHIASCPVALEWCQMYQGLQRPPLSWVFDFFAWLTTFWMHGIS